MTSLAQAAPVKDIASGATARFAETLPGNGTPFSLTVGPEQAVPHRAWREARERVLDAVCTGSRLVLVLGPAGTGKTLLLQEIARTFRADVGTDALLQPRGDLPIGAGSAVADGAARLRRRVVLVDEADRMNKATLDCLGALGQCAFVLAGRRLADPGNGKPPPGGGKSSAAAAVVVRLTALSPGEVTAFVAARLVQARVRADLLSDEAVARLAEWSDGVPRVLNMLAGAALLLARTEGASRIEAGHVDQAAALRGGDAGVSTARPPEVVPVVPAAAPHQKEVEPQLSSAAATSPPDSSPLGAGVAVLSPPRSRAPLEREPEPARRRRATAFLCAGIAAVTWGAWLASWPRDEQRSQRAPPPAMATTAGAAAKFKAPPSTTLWTERQQVAVAATPPAAAPTVVPLAAPADPVSSALAERAPKLDAAASLLSPAPAPKAEALSSALHLPMTAPVSDPLEPNAARASPAAPEDAAVVVPATPAPMVASLKSQESGTVAASSAPVGVTAPLDRGAAKGGQVADATPETARLATEPDGAAPPREADPGADATGSLGPGAPLPTASNDRRSAATMPEPLAVAPRAGTSRLQHLATVRPPAPDAMRTVAAGTANRVAGLAWSKGHATNQASDRDGWAVSAAPLYGVDQPTGPALDRRCRNILVRAQLGEESYVDQARLRDRCKPP